MNNGRTSDLAMMAGRVDNGGRMMETRNEPAQPRRPGSWLRVLAVGRKPKRTLVRAGILGVGCVVVFKFVLLPVRVAGISMVPTYADHSVNFVNRLSFLWHEPKRGDVVGVRLTPPDGWSAPHIMYLKRVIGLPEETISFVDGRPQVNGRTLDEPYEQGPCDWNTTPVTLGPEEYFVVGDNRAMSKEEHVFGRTERNRIVGKALL